MKNTLLTLKNVSVSMDNGNSYILKDISFSMKKWEILSIIWQNWSGKSTLLKVIAGIQKLHSGHIKREDVQMSYVPQHLDIDKSFPIWVIDFIQTFNANTTKESIEKLLKKFESQHLSNKLLSNLSGWEFQKVLIVSSMLSNPDLILLDEPTSGIDIAWEEIFYKNIHKLQKHFPDTSIIIISHNINLVYKHSDTVLCLHKNNYCCHWTPKELEHNDSFNEIFWELTLPYIHKPHAKHHHH